MLGFKGREELLKIASDAVSRNAQPDEVMVDMIPQARVDPSIGFFAFFGALIGSFLAVLLGALVTKFFMVILTNKRLIFVEMGMTFNVLAVNGYFLNEVKLIKFKRGLLQYKMVLLLPGQTKNMVLRMPKNGLWKLAPEKIAAALTN